MWDNVAGATAWVGAVADLMDVGRVLILALTMVGFARIGVGYAPTGLRPTPERRCCRCRRRLRGKG